MVRSAPSSSSLTHAAYERLRADLLACRLQPGARLKLNELCDALSVSLSAVREALSRLTSEGLVVAEPQRGFRVAPISADELRDLTSVRAQVEGMCLDRAIAVGDVDWESRVVGAFHRLSRTPEREPGDAQRMNEERSLVHAAYHEALVSACDSPWLLRLRMLLYTQSERYRRLSIPVTQIARDLNQEHRDLMEATLGRDAERAKTLMAQHIELTTRVLLEQAWATDAPPKPVRSRMASSVPAAVTTRRSVPPHAASAAPRTPALRSTS